MSDGTCDHCSEPYEQQFTCRYCEQTLCVSCRLPEAHDCIYLPFVRGSDLETKHFESTAESTLTDTASDLGEEPSTETEYEPDRQPDSQEVEWQLPSSMNVEFESSPPVQTKENSETKKQEQGGLLSTLWNLLGL